MFSKKLKTNLLPNAITEIIRQVEASDLLTGKQAMNILLSARVQEESLERFVDFEHASDECYGRKVLYQGKNFELMVMSWKPGDYSAIHNHGIAGWGAVKVFGQMDHISYLLEEGELKTCGMIRLNERNIIDVSEGLMHQMGNPGSENVISLHLYGINGNDYIPNVTQDSELFDLTKKQIHLTDKGAFYELNSAFIKKSIEGPSGDFPTWLSNLTRQIDRNKKMGHFNELKGLLMELRSADKRERLLNFLDGKLDSSGEFKDKFQEKVFITALLGLGAFIGEYPEYNPDLNVSIQLDKSKSIFIIHINDQQILLDYSYDKLVMS